VDEVGRIEMLARVLAAAGPGVELGIGDDAAVLARPAGRLVWTIDEQVEGVHFRRDLVSWRDVGWRSFMAAASDVAAMGAAPWCALAALTLPDDVDDEALEAIARGQREAAGEAGAPVVGGNLSRGPAVSIATTLLGTCDRPVTRSAARPGDGLWMAGRVGLAAAGLQALAQGKGHDPRLAAAVAAWRAPRALLAAGRAMGAVAHAAVDVSDGLARDVGHVALASGVRVVLDAAALLQDDGLRDAASALGAEALDLALHGGEDYALAAASDAPIEGFRRIGEVRAGRGLALRTRQAERELEPRGFDHFLRTDRPPGPSRSGGPGAAG
jgi:thiamine-monophosphate kinase